MSIRRWTDKEDVVHMYNEILLLFSRSVMSDSLQSIRLQHARLPCPSLSQSLVKLMSIESVMPSNYLILCHPLLVLPSVFPSIRVFSTESVLHIWCPNSGTSASASVIPMNIQGWFPLELTGLISLQSKGLSRVFSNITVQKHQFFGTQTSLWSNSHIHTWLLEKPYLWLYRPLLAKWCLCFLIHCLICHSFPSKEQVSFNFMAAVTICRDFGAQENKICHCFYFFPFYLPWSDETVCHDLSFFNVEF